MCKGLFKVKSMQKSKRGNLKSYSKKRASYAKSFAVCVAIVTLASCGEKTDNSMFQTVKNAADAYRSYLTEVRKEENLPTERLIEKINDWQSLRDSVSPVSPKTRQTVFTPITKAKFVDCTIRCALNLLVWLWRSRELTLMCCSSKKRLPNIYKTQNWHER